MTASLWSSVLAVAAGGAVGALARFGVGIAMTRWHEAAAPLGTLFVNVMGCLLIGLLLPWFNQANVPVAIRQLLITGFCGGLTTFSTFGYEVLLLARVGSRPDVALLYMIANLTLGIGAVWAGARIFTWIAS